MRERLLGLLSTDFRADLRRLNRFAVYDRQWLRTVRKRRKAPEARPAGKFNAGQKIRHTWLEDPSGYAGCALQRFFTEQVK